MRKILALPLALTALVAMAGPASAVPVVTAPGGFQSGYVPPVIVIAPGESIEYTNLDVASHNFVADGSFIPKKAAKKVKWCSGYDKGKCPLFWSPAIGLGETTPVSGLDRVKSGGQYGFFCTIHPNMKGTLVVR
jgi:plastocyanin